MRIRAVTSASVIFLGTVSFFLIVEETYIFPASSFDKLRKNDGLMCIELTSYKELSIMILLLILPTTDHNGS